MSRQAGLNRRWFLKNAGLGALAAGAASAGAPLAAAMPSVEQSTFAPGPNGKYDFDTPYNRFGTNSVKYDQQIRVYGPNSVYPNGLDTSIPAYKPAADPTKPLFKPSPALGNQDLWKTAIEAGNQIPGGTPIPKWWAGAVDYLGNDVQKMLDGSMTPQQVIDQSTADIQKNLVDRQ